MRRRSRYGERFIHGRLDMLNHEGRLYVDAADVIAIVRKAGYGQAADALEEALVDGGFLA